MINKSFGAIYFHFKIFSEKKQQKKRVKICIFWVGKICPRMVHFILLTLFHRCVVFDYLSTFVLITNNTIFHMWDLMANRFSSFCMTAC